MNKLLNDLEETVAFLTSSGIHSPVVGVVLGTGLGELVNHISVEKTIPYNEIPHFPASTVEFHKGNLIWGKIGDIKVLAMQGRFHYYEGYSMQQITFPIRVMKLLGVKHLLLSNAAGGMNLAYKKGDLVIITDHINTQTENPLRGLTDEAFGPRFPDMSDPYSKPISELLRNEAIKLGIAMHAGVYVAVNGPNLETKAEYKHLKAAGADMVGMSTVPEVIVANQVGLPCAAVSVITDECDPENLQPVDISEIIAVAGKADKRLSNIFAQVIRQLD
ncbi:MAG: purine-nucleoside phosphorylase [Ferruginibacter sp.]